MTNWDFSADEGFFLCAAGIATLFGAATWYRPLHGSRLRGPVGIRAALAVAPAVCLAATYVILMRWSDPVYVAGHADYVVLFMVGASAWMAGAAVVLAVLGIGPAEDAVERDNAAAAAFVCLFLMAVTATYAGANVGAGPTIWTTLVPAATGTLILFGCVVVTFSTSNVPDAISIDRDVAAGVRTGGLALACGVILGRAAGGDWVSWSSTFGDLFVISWPVLVLLVVGEMLNRSFLPTPARPVPALFRCGVVPAVVFVAAAVLYLWYLGPPDIGRHVITYEQYMNSR